MPGFMAEAMTWPENYHVTVAVETALSLGLPPLEFLYAERQGGVWTRIDKRLAVAFNIMNKETCGQCGNPVWVCRNTSRNVDFSVKTAICHAKAAIGRKEEQLAKQKNGALKPGQYLYTEAKQVSGEPLERGLREQYYEAL